MAIFVVVFYYLPLEDNTSPCTTIVDECSLVVENKILSVTPGLFGAGKIMSSKMSFVEEVARSDSEVGTKLA